MQTLEEEINRIKKELADIGFKFTFGKTCEELIEEIFAETCGSIPKRS